MKMIDLPNLALPLLTGGLLGAIFFGGLWWTVHRGVLSPWPAVWFLASFLLRAAIALVGFYFAGQNDWHRLLACMVGFVMARFLVTLLTRSPLPHRNQTNQGARF
jgi:F1F0 ATPase subunit 2